MQPAVVDPTTHPKVSAVIHQMRLHRLRWGVLGVSDLSKDSKRFKELFELCDSDADVDCLITYANDVRWVNERKDRYNTPEIAWVFE